MACRIFLILAGFLILVGTAAAQSGTAIDIEPGVTFYSGPGGGTLSVETMPGVQRFSGAVNGSAIETLPGVRHYNFGGSWDDDIQAGVRAEMRERQRSFEAEQQERRLRDAVERGRR